MAINPIHFTYKNLSAFTEWLKKKPSGQWRVLISGAPETDATLNAIMDKLDKGTGRWLKNKLSNGDIKVKVTSGFVGDLPEGEWWTQ